MKYFIDNAPVIIICVMVGLVVASVVFSVIMETYRISIRDPNCIQRQKEYYCGSIDMELTHKVVTTGGLFSQVVDKEICSNSKGEKLIETRDINWGACPIK